MEVVTQRLTFSSRHHIGYPPRCQRLFYSGMQSTRNIKPRPCINHHHRPTKARGRHKTIAFPPVFYIVKETDVLSFQQLATFFIQTGYTHE
jgi:hypothetical protein